MTVTKPKKAVGFTPNTQPACPAPVKTSSQLVQQTQPPSSAVPASKVAKPPEPEFVLPDTIPEGLIVSTQQNTKVAKREKPVHNPTQLLFTPYAWAKLVYLRDAGPTEVGGFGVAQDVERPLLITDFSLVDQECTAAFTSFDEEAVDKFFDERRAEGMSDQQFGRIWIHTHPGNSADPSGTDEATFKDTFGVCDWAIMFILAKGGETYARLRVTSVSEFVMVRELDVRLAYREEFPASEHAQWEAEYKATVRKQYGYVHHNNYKGPSNQGAGAGYNYGYGYNRDDEPSWYDKTHTPHRTEVSQGPLNDYYADDHYASPGLATGGWSTEPTGKKQDDVIVDVAGGRKPGSEHNDAINEIIDQFQNDLEFAEALSQDAEVLYAFCEAQRWIDLDRRVYFQSRWMKAKECYRICANEVVLAVDEGETTEDLLRLFRPLWQDQRLGYSANDEQLVEEFVQMFGCEFIPLFLAHPEVMAETDFVDLLQDRLLDAYTGMVSGEETAELIIPITDEDDPETDIDPELTKFFLEEE